MTPAKTELIGNEYDYINIKNEDVDKLLENSAFQDSFRLAVTGTADAITQRPPDQFKTELRRVLQGELQWRSEKG